MSEVQIRIRNSSNSQLKIELQGFHKTTGYERIVPTVKGGSGAGGNIIQPVSASTPDDQLPSVTLDKAKDGSKNLIALRRLKTSSFGNENKIVTLPASSYYFNAHADNEGDIRLFTIADGIEETQVQTFSVIRSLALKVDIGELHVFKAALSSGGSSAHAQLEKMQQALNDTVHFKKASASLYMIMQGYTQSTSNAWAGSYNVYLVNNTDDYEVHYGPAKTQGTFTIKDNGSIDAEVEGRSITNFTVNTLPSSDKDYALIESSTLSLTPIYAPPQMYKKPDGKHATSGLPAIVFNGTLDGQPAMAMPTTLTFSFRKDNRDWMSKLTPAESLILSVLAFTIGGKLIEGIFKKAKDWWKERRTNGGGPNEEAELPGEREGQRMDTLTERIDRLIEMQELFIRESRVLPNRMIDPNESVDPFDNLSELLNGDLMLSETHTGFIADLRRDDLDSLGESGVADSDVLNSEYSAVDSAMAEAGSFMDKSMFDQLMERMIKVDDSIAKLAEGQLETLTDRTRERAQTEQVRRKKAHDREVEEQENRDAETKSQEFDEEV